MAARSVQVDLRVRDRISREYRRIQRAIGTDNKRIRTSMKRVQFDSKKAMDGMKRSIFSVKTAMVALGAVFTGLVVRSFIRAGSEVEDLTTQFKVLLGTTEAAKKRMEELAVFAQTTPFQLEDVAKASRLLQVLTEGALATGDALRTVGDAAAASGANFEELAMWVGRAYSGLKANRPIGEALMRLTELGIVTGETRSKIEELQQSGRGVEAWTVLQGALKKSEGGMAELAKTVTGLTSTIKDQLAAVMRQMLDSGIWDKLRESLERVVKFFNKSLEDGTFERWGQSLLKLGGDMVKVATFLGKLGKAYTDFVLTITGNDEETKNAGKNYLNNLDELRKLLPLVSELQDILNGEVGEYNTISKQLERRDFLAAQIESIRGIPTDLTKVNGLMNVLVSRFDELGSIPQGPYQEALTGVSVWAEKMLKEHEGNAAAIEEIRIESFKRVMEIQKKFGKLDPMLGPEDDPIARAKNLAEEQKKVAADVAAFEQMQVDNTLKMKEEAGQKEKAMIEQLKAARQQAGADFVNNLRTLAGSFKEFGGIFKAAAISQTIIDTYKGAQGAFAALSGIPLVGPVLGGAAAAAAIGAGLARVAAIKAQKFAGGGFLGDGPTSGDQTLFRGNRGEVILNTAQQRNFMRLANGGAGSSITFGDINITSSSGDPNEIAGAVDRTMQERLRDLQDLINQKDALLVT